MRRAWQLCDFSVRVSRENDAALARVAGEVDLHTAGQLERQLADLVEDGATDIVVDLAELTFMDTTGLGALVRTAGRLRERHGRIVLRFPPRTVQTMLEITRAQALLPTIRPNCLATTGDERSRR